MAPAPEKSTRQILSEAGSEPLPALTANDPTGAKMAAVAAQADKLHTAKNATARSCGGLEDAIQDTLDSRTTKAKNNKTRAGALTAVLSAVGTVATITLGLNVKDDSSASTISGSVTGVVGAGGGLLTALVAGEDDTIPTLRSRKEELKQASTTIPQSCPAPDSKNPDEVLAVLKTCETAMVLLQSRCDKIAQKRVADPK